MPRRGPPPKVTRMQIGVMNSHGGGAWACLERRAVGAATGVEPTRGVKSGRCGRSDFRADLELARGQLGERLADPMALVLIGLHAPRLHEAIGVFVPTAL